MPQIAHFHIYRKIYLSAHFLHLVFPFQVEYVTSFPKKKLKENYQFLLLLLRSMYERSHLHRTPMKINEQVYFQSSSRCHNEYLPSDFL